jgi:hypothetical protein
MVVFDVSSPANPSVVAVLDTPGDSMGIALSGERAYLAEDSFGLDGGLRVVDVSSPSDPVEIGFVRTMGFARDLSIAGDHAFVVDRPDRLAVFEVSTPSEILEVGSIETALRPMAIGVSEGHVFVAEGGDIGGGLEIFDISVPSMTFPVALFDLPYPATCLALSGQHAFVGARELWVIDVSIPSRPIEVGFMELGDARGIAASGDIVYVADGPWGLRVIDVSAPSAPVEVAAVLNSGRDVELVAVSGQHAFAIQDRVLRVLDISDPSSPVEVGSIGDPPSYPTDLVVSDGRADVTVGSRGLWVVDVSDPASPVEVGRAETAGDAPALAADGDVVFVADDDAGLSVYDTAGCAHRLPSPRHIGGRVVP